QQVAVEVGHQRSDVAAGEIDALFAALQVAHVTQHAGTPETFVSGVHAVVLRFLRDADIRMRKNELTPASVQRKAVDTVAGRVNEHAARTVDHVTGSDKIASDLQAIFERAAA